MKYSFWSIPSNDSKVAHQFLNQFGYKINNSTATKFDEINCAKLWHRKYFFSGPTQSILLQEKDSLFLMEEIPSSLFYADAINLEFSKVQKIKVVLFFHYHSAKSVGLKIFEEGKLARHIQSEIDYELCNNIGTQLDFEKDIVKELNKFSENDLFDYLKQLQIPIPTITKDTTVDLLSMSRI